jgi:porphobilinogen synthase
MIYGKFPYNRMRRKRQNIFIRDLFSETNILPKDLIQPFFVIEGNKTSEQIASMPKINRLSIDLIINEISELIDLGINYIILFPCIEEKKKTLTAKTAYENGLIQNCIYEIKNKYPNIIIISDIALDPYTCHGHDGIIDKHNNVLNDETIDILKKQALSHVQAGSDIIAPSDMMDGRIKLIREELEKNNFINKLILSYSVKYASNYYGPFRFALKNKNLHLSKDTYQMDKRNALEANQEVALDIEEGADIIMIKPGMPYLDIIYNIKKTFQIPVFSYQVSGEYSMHMAAINNGWLSEQVIIESLICLKRAGSNAIVTYFAKKASQLINNKNFSS